MSTKKIEELENEIKRLQNLLATDELTGLLRKGAWFERFYAARSLLTRNKNFGFAVAVIDLDNFKKINDTLGHAEGDRVLKKVASLLKENISLSDVIGRYGGDEFMILFNRTSPAKAASACRRILSVLNDNGIQASIGVVGEIDDVLCLDRIFEKADKTMYAAKKHSKNTVFSLSGELTCEHVYE